MQYIIWHEENYLRDNFLDNLNSFETVEAKNSLKAFIKWIKHNNFDECIVYVLSLEKAMDVTLKNFDSIDRESDYACSIADKYSRTKEIKTTYKIVKEI